MPSSRAVGFLVSLTLLGVGSALAAGRRLPDFSLRDPAGRVHTRASLAAEGLILVVTAPTLASEDAQRGWDDHLRAARPAEVRGRVAFLEDLDQSWFPDMAVRAMRETYDPGSDPVLLLDRKGAIRRALGVERGATVLLVYDAAGERCHRDAGAPSAAGARRAWSALLGDVVRADPTTPPR